MNLSLWSAIREYISAEFNLSHHRIFYGNPIRTVEETTAQFPDLYKSEREINLLRACYERDCARRAELEEISTRCEAEVRRLIEALPEPHTHDAEQIEALNMFRRY